MDEVCRMNAQLDVCLDGEKTDAGLAITQAEVSHCCQASSDQQKESAVAIDDAYPEDATENCKISQSSNLSFCRFRNDT